MRTALFFTTSFALFNVAKTSSMAPELAQVDGIFGNLFGSSVVPFNPDDCLMDCKYKKTDETLLDNVLYYKERSDNVMNVLTEGKKAG